MFSFGTKQFLESSWFSLIFLSFRVAFQPFLESSFQQVYELRDVSDWCHVVSRVLALNADLLLMFVLFCACASISSHMRMWGELPLVPWANSAELSTKCGRKTQRRPTTRVHSQQLYTIGLGCMTAYYVG